MVGVYRGFVARFLVLAVVLSAFVSTGYADTQPFTLVFLPDTQCYADIREGDEGLSHIFHKQTAWVKENKDKLNIVMAAHAGDIVQTDFEEEWKVADQAYRTLDGVVPYCVVPGNHDMGFRVEPRATATSRETLFNKYFPPSRFEAYPWYGGHYGDGNENNFCLFRGGGMEFLIISLEFKPRDEVLEWANKVVDEHPNHRCLVVTHAYLNREGRRIESDKYEIAGNSGEDIWRKFVSRHKNIFMVLCGHISTETMTTSLGENGNEVHEIMSDYQSLDNGGDGFLRVITFVPEEDLIKIQAYSPMHGEYEGHGRPAESAPSGTRDLDIPYAMSGKALEAAPSK